MLVKEPIKAPDSDPDSSQPSGWRWQDVSIAGELTNQQELFARVLASTNNQTRAYRVAYGTPDTVPKTCAIGGARLARHPKVRARLQEIREDARKVLADKAGLTADRIAQLFYEMAMADPNEIIGAKVGCCRYCYGDGHMYQWKEHEYLAELAKWESLSDTLKAQTPMPDVAGGLEFDQTIDPNADCPNCMGEGEFRVVVRDTSQLSDGARMLYQGVKQTKNGIEIQIADRAKMLENLARILGAFKDSTQVNVQAVAIAAMASDPASAQKAYLAMLEASGPA